MTTSLYGTPSTPGEVASTNFTTLYSNTTQAVPVQVSGNTTYEIASQATTGGANLLLTGSDGSTDTVKYASGVGIAVSSTDGSTILITNTSPAGTTYNIDATAAIGGANLNLYGSDSTLDSVKFAGGSNVTVTRTDASTITISSVADNIPDGTAQGQVLYWDGSAWTANSVITFNASDNRLTAVNNVVGGSTAFQALKQYSGTLLDAASVGQLFGFTNGGAFVSPTNPIYTHRLLSEYDTAGNPLFRIQADPVGNFAAASTTTYSQLRINNDNLEIHGNQFIVNFDLTGAPTEDGIFKVNRGSSTDATLTWDETQDRWEFSNPLEVQGQITGTSNLDLNGTNITLISGHSGAPTQNASITVDRGSSANAEIVWDETDDRWELTDNVLAAGWLGAQADVIYINWDNTAIDSYLSFKGVNNEYIKWNNTDSRFEFSDQIYNSQTDIPAVLERRSLTSEINTPTEFKSALRLTQRITDAPNNDTTTAGPGITFSRTSGATDPTERIFASLGAAWNGATTTADWSFNWSNDNFAEPTPGVFPGSYQLLQLGSNRAKFQNDSIYIDYDTAGAALVGINTGTPAYTLDVNGDANVSGDIYVSGVHVDLTTPVHQGQLLYVSNDVTPTITNGSTIAWTVNTYRPNFQGDNGINGRNQTGAIVSNNTGAVNFDTGDGSGLLVGVDSDGQSLVYMGSLSSTYVNGGNHQIRLSTSTNNFTSDQATSITGGNTLVFPTAHGFSIGDKLAYAGKTQNGLTFDTYYYVISTGFTTTQCQVSLTQGGSAVALTNGTGLSLWFFNKQDRVFGASSTEATLAGKTLVLNATNTGIAFTGTAGLEVERGTSGSNQTFNWNETDDRWEASSDFYAPVATIGYVDISRTSDASTVQIDTNSGKTLTLDSDGGTVLVNDNFNVDAGVLYVDATNNYVGVNDLTPSYPLDVNGIINTNSAVQCDLVTVDNQATLDTNTLTTTSTSTVTLNATARNAMTGLVNIIQGSNVHCVNYTALRVDATTALLTTFGEMYNTTSLASFTADVSGGLLRLLITPTSATSTVFSAVRTSLT